MTDRNKWLAQAKQVLQKEAEGILEVSSYVDESFCEALELLANCTGRVIISGIGKSGLVGKKIAATMSSTGTATFFLHPVEGVHGDLGIIREGDVVICLSNSGETIELNNILPVFRSLGVKIIAMTSNKNSKLAKSSDIFLCTKVSEEACSMNLVPTTSTTATLALGDALAICLMNYKSFDQKDFKKIHPAGALGERLSKSLFELMHQENLPVCLATESFLSASKILDKGNFGFLAVVDTENKLVGALTDGDIRRLFCSGKYNELETIEECMIKNPYKIVASAKSAEALDIMEKNQIMVLPVVDETDVLQGIIHLHDILGKGRVSFS